MRERLARDLDAAEHARDLFLTGFARKRMDAGGGGVAIAGLGHAQVRVTLCRDLRQMGHAEHLAA